MKNLLLVNSYDVIFGKQYFVCKDGVWYCSLVKKTNFGGPYFLLGLKEVLVNDSRVRIYEIANCDNEFDHTFRDGSYNMAIVNGKLENILGLSMIGRRRRVKVVLYTLPVLPYYPKYGGTPNDTIVIDEQGTVIFTQKRFLKKLSYVVKEAKFDTYEEALKHGTPTLVNVNNM